MSLSQEKKTPPTVTKETRTIQTKLQTRELTEGEANKRTIIGSIRYDSESHVMTDWYGDEFVEVIAPGAFAEYLRNNPTISLWCHRTDQILGNTQSNTLRIMDGDTELRFECDLPNTTVGNDAWESINRGDVNGVSFGFNTRTNGDRWSKIERDGKNMYKRTILFATLPEISPTPFAAYPENDVQTRSLQDFKAEEQRALNEYRKRLLSLELDLM